MLINVKVPTIIGILTSISMINTTSESLKANKKPLFFSILVFMSSWNLMISWVEHEKRFITSRPGIQIRDVLAPKHMFKLMAKKLINFYAQKSLLNWTYCVFWSIPSISGALWQHKVGNILTHANAITQIYLFVIKMHIFVKWCILT